jgi:hypothetical protein
MADIQAAWRGSLSGIKNEVTGRTLWQALDAVVPIVQDGDTVVLGLPGQSSSMLGHLKATPTMRAIEKGLSKALGISTIRIEIIAGDSLADWDSVKTREEHVTRLQQEEYFKAKEVKLKEQAWESAYEQLSRIYAGITNKSLPQNRAKYLTTAVGVIVEAIETVGKDLDEVGDRSVARLIERVASYTEMDSTYIALLILQKLGMV